MKNIVILLLTCISTFPLLAQESPQRVTVTLEDGQVLTGQYTEHSISRESEQKISIVISGKKLPSFDSGKMLSLLIEKQNMPQTANIGTPKGDKITVVLNNGQIVEGTYRGHSTSYNGFKNKFTFNVKGKNLPQFNTGDVAAIAISRGSDAQHNPFAQQDNSESNSSKSNNENSNGQNTTESGTTPNDNSVASGNQNNNTQTRASERGNTQNDNSRASGNQNNNRQNAPANGNIPNDNSVASGNQNNKKTNAPENGNNGKEPNTKPQNQNKSKTNTKEEEKLNGYGNCSFLGYNFKANDIRVIALSDEPGSNIYLEDSDQNLSILFNLAVVSVNNYPLDQLVHSMFYSVILKVGSKEYFSVSGQLKISKWNKATGSIAGTFSFEVKETQEGPTIKVTGGSFSKN
jgi:hypothetical protein